MGKEQLLSANPVLRERSALAWSKVGLLKVPCRSVTSMLRGSLLEIQTLSPTESEQLRVEPRNQSLSTLPKLPFMKPWSQIHMIVNHSRNVALLLPLSQTVLAPGELV